MRGKIAFLLLAAAMMTGCGKLQEGSMKAWETSACQAEQETKGRKDETEGRQEQKTEGQEEQKTEGQEGKKAEEQEGQETEGRTEQKTEGREWQETEEQAEDKTEDREWRKTEEQAEQETEGREWRKTEEQAEQETEGREEQENSGEDIPGRELWERPEQEGDTGTGSAGIPECVGKNEHGNRITVLAFGQQEPDCFYGALYDVKCGDCGEYLEAIYREPLGHDGGEGVVVCLPDCTGGGSIRYTCLRCGFEWSEAYGQIQPHTWLEGIRETTDWENGGTREIPYRYCGICGVRQE